MQFLILDKSLETRQQNEIETETINQPIAEVSSIRDNHEDTTLINAATDVITESNVEAARQSCADSFDNFMAFLDTTIKSLKELSYSQQEWNSIYTRNIKLSADINASLNRSRMTNSVEYSKKVRETVFVATIKRIVDDLNSRTEKNFMTSLLLFKLLPENISSFSKKEATDLLTKYQNVLENIGSGEI